MLEKEREVTNDSVSKKTFSIKKLKRQKELEERFRYCRDKILQSKKNKESHITKEK